jgi:acyl-CoA synthetase (NDP forming)
LPQPDPERAERLRALLPGIATPCNPQDITMAAWNDLERQTAIYRELLGQGFDLAIMGQNYPREGMWDIAEYSAQVEAMGQACRELGVAGAQLAPLVDCFPADARQHTQDQSMAALQGLSESIAALSHAVWWQEQRDVLLEELPALSLAAEVAPASSQHRAYDEAEAKRLLADAGLTIPAQRVCSADDPGALARAAGELGFPVALKALDARLLHKTEVGALALGLSDAQAVSAALATMRADMAEQAAHIPLTRVLLEAMAEKPVVEVLASVSHDPAVGPVMMIAGGGLQAELWNDSQLIAAPFTRYAIAQALSRLKIARLLDGWRGQPAGDRPGLIDALLNLARCAEQHSFQEIEINPLFVGQRGITVVDAVIQG